MAYKILIFSCILFIVTFANVLVDEKSSNNVLKCQFGKSDRKQIDVWPLSGMCMRDMVIHLSKHLRTLSNEELGVTVFQENLDKLEFINNKTPTKAKLDSLVHKLNMKIKSYTDVLEVSNNIIQPILLQESANFYPNSKYDDTNRLSDICSRIIDSLAINLRSSEWKNLHVLPVKQPKTMCGPPSLEHNIGPLLLSQCSKSKNVVLLLEHNSLMTEEDVALAQITAKTVVKMLTETDSVSVIGLAANKNLYCHNKSLLKATDIHKIRLNRYIDTLTRVDSNVTSQFDIKYFLKELSDDVILIHLTNIYISSSEIKKNALSVASKNLTVHFGTILLMPHQQSNIKYQMFSINSSTITLPTQHVLGYEIAKLFSGIKCKKEDVKKYYLSDPYFEPHSKVMMISIGHITNTALLSFDARLREFIEDITYFNAGEHIHATLIDKQGVVWMHKSFPRMETIVEQPLKVYFHNIERFNESDILRSGIYEKEEGTYDLKTKSGVKKRLLWRHLYYNDLIVCLIIQREDDYILVVKNPPSLPYNILHHRLDLTLQTSYGKDMLCSYSNNRIGSLEAGVIYFSPWCFQSPTEQFEQLEAAPSVTVQSYMAYIKDGTRLLVNPGLQPYVKSDVATLSQIINYFKSRHMDSSMSKFIVQRYVTSVTSGVLEVFPGIVLDSELDPKRRSWYTKALENPGVIIMTPPYLDASGAGYVVTLSHTAYEGRPAALHSNKDPVVAVLSMDLTLGYIARMLTEMFPFCKEANMKCFIIDDQGNLIYHPKLLEPSAKVEGQHLTNEEFLVSNDILNHENFIKKSVCASHLDGTIQRFYRLNTTLDEVLTNIVHGEHCVLYQLAAVPGTNAFLGVVNITCNTSSFCPCSTMNRQCLNCIRMEQTDCECPCECSMFSEECNDKATQDSTNEEIEICSAPTEQGASQPAPWVRPGVLSSCQTVSCQTYNTKDQCLGIVGCQWCELETAGKSLQTPYCSDLSVCFGGILGAAIPYGDGTYNLQSSEELMDQEWSSVGPAAGVLLSMMLILGVSLFCYRLRNVPSGLEHQFLHMHNSPDTLRMTNLDGDIEPTDFEREQKGTMDSALLRDVLAPISPYRVFSNYRRPAGGDSDHGYSTMTPHEDSEQHAYVEPLLIISGDIKQDAQNTSTTKATTEKSEKENETVPATTQIESSPHRVLVPVTVHRNMETNYC